MGVSLWSAALIHPWHRALSAVRCVAASYLLYIFKFISGGVEKRPRLSFIRLIAASKKGSSRTMSSLALALFPHVQAASFLPILHRPCQVSVQGDPRPLVMAAEDRSDGSPLFLDAPPPREVKGDV